MSIMSHDLDDEQLPAPLTMHTTGEYHTGMTGMDVLMLGVGGQCRQLHSATEGEIMLHNIFCANGGRGQRGYPPFPCGSGE